MKFELSDEHIPLNALLKVSGLSLSGGEANQLISGGKVTVNNEVETRKRRKIKSGDKVSLGSDSIDVS